MTSDNIVTLIVAFFGSTLVAAWLGYLSAKRKFPLEVQTVKADAAKTITDTAMTLMTEVKERLTKVEGEVSSLTAHSATQDKEISKLRLHIGMWVAWAEGLRFNWESVRMNIDPPDLPDAKVQTHEPTEFTD